MRRDAIEPAEAARRHAEEDDFVLLDCRESEELALAAIDGALHVPMAEIPARIAMFDRDRTYAVLCHHGVRSALVVAFLRRAGLPSVLNVSGGIDAWARDVDSDLPRYG